MTPPKDLMESVMKFDDLQRDSVATVEGRQNSRVNKNIQIFLNRDVLIPFKNPLLDPCCKVVSDNGINLIHQPLFWEFRPFLEDWEMSKSLWDGEDVLADMSKLQALILRNI
jgi:hypothetical protein